MGPPNLVAADNPPDDDAITDDELAALALAADPDQPIDPRAVPMTIAADSASGLLPDWYMPRAVSPVRGPLRRSLVGFVVLALLAINAAGLCVTNGFPEIAW